MLSLFGVSTHVVIELEKITTCRTELVNEAEDRTACQVNAVSRPQLFRHHKARKSVRTLPVLGQAKYCYAIVLLQHLSESLNLGESTITIS